MRSTTETLIAAMRILARDIQSGDGVANAAIAEAADRLEELQKEIAIVKEKCNLFFSSLECESWSTYTVYEVREWHEFKAAKEACE